MDCQDDPGVNTGDHQQNKLQMHLVDTNNESTQLQLLNYVPRKDCLQNRLIYRV